MNGVEYKVLVKPRIYSARVVMDVIDEKHVKWLDFKAIDRTDSQPSLCNIKL